jgi:hypothetical protein
MDETTRVITLPPKERVNIGLAALAGALAVLVVITAHETFTAGSRAGVTPLPTPAVIRSAEPTAAPTDAPAQRAAQPAQKNGKGKGRD